MKFEQSEVLRELERQAVKKGFFDPTEKEIVQHAAKQIKKIEPTGNLFVDLCILADGLQARGYVKQANELAKKIALYKTAEVHMYRAIDEDGEDLLDFAHPDGDADLVDAGDLGKVETLGNIAKKIREVALKSPSGKLSISKAASLVKQAQDEELAGMLPPELKDTVQAGLDTILKASSALFVSDEYQKKIVFTEENLKQSQFKNLYLKYLKNDKNLKDSLDNYLFVKATVGILTPDRIILWLKSDPNKLASCENQLGISIQQRYLTGVTQTMAGAIGGGIGSGIGAPMALPLGGIPGAMVGSGIGKQWGAGIAESISGSMLNPSSIYRETAAGKTEIIEEKLSGVAAVISSAYRRLMDSAIGYGGGFLQAAANVGKGVAAAYNKKVKAAQDTLGTPEQYLTEFEVSHKVAAEKLEAAKVAYEKVKAETAPVKELAIFAAEGEWPENWPDSAFDNLFAQMRIGFDQMFKGQATGATIPAGINAPLVEAARFWKAEAAKLTNQDDIDKANKNMYIAAQVAKLLKDNEGRSLAALKRAARVLESTAPGLQLLKSISELQQYVAQSAAVGRKAAQDNPEIIKTAAVQLDIKPIGGERGVSSTKPAVSSGRGYAAPAPKQAPEAAEAIKKMQLMIKGVGQALQHKVHWNTKFPNELSKDAAAFNALVANGQWGKSTVMCLRLIVEHFLSAAGMINKGQIVEEYDPENAEQNAEDNIYALANLMNYMGASVYMPNSVKSLFAPYDKIPEEMSRINTRETGLLEIGPQDLQNLSSFYNFLESLNSIDLQDQIEKPIAAQTRPVLVDLKNQSPELETKPKTASNPAMMVAAMIVKKAALQGITVNQFDFAIKWLSARSSYARHSEDLRYDPEGRRRTERYISDVARLRATWNKVKSNIIKKRGPNGIIDPVEDLEIAFSGSERGSASSRYGRGRRTGEGDEGGYNIGGGGSNPPFSKDGVLDTTLLIHNYGVEGPDAEWVLANVTPPISYEFIVGAETKNIQSNYGMNSNINPAAHSIYFSTRVKNVIAAAFKNYYTEAIGYGQDPRTVKTIRSQNELKESWITALDNLNSRATRALRSAQNPGRVPSGVYESARYRGF